MTRALELAPPSPLGVLASGRPLLAFDFDGVLAPLVARAEDVELRQRTRELLTQLARQARCAVISGRSLATIGELTRGVPFHDLIGNHGAEWRGHRVRGGAKLARQVQGWRSALAPVVARLGAGVELEDKHFSLSVHYRGARDPGHARRAVLAACRRLHGARIVAGKKVINLVSASAPNKGDALLALCGAARATPVLFVGDDQTDEDVFALRHRWPALITLRVGPSRSSQAAYHVSHQRDVDRLLAALVDQTSG